MESADPSNHSKRSLRRNSNSHISMSDTESTTSQVDSWHSPLRSESPLRSDDPSFLPENDDSGSKNSRSLVVVDKYYSPVPSPGKSSVPAGSLAAGGKGRRPWPHSEKPTSDNLDLPTSFPAEGGKDGRRGGTPAEKPVAENLDVPAKGTSPVVVGLNKFVREEQPPDVKKVEPVGGDGGVWRVMAADKTQGWSGDSFDRYVEYRYCLAVNVIGFVYSGFQAFDLAYHLGTGKHVFAHHLRYHFDFTMDQASNIS
ncbi:UNVERIFIED_CONTAM: CASP-like protein 4A3 [Sesamum calycinum]|uniref:CASP-like protein n=1 Tax=Sesamum calycinum TaxID=2727403 RepID=A0AAW2PT28_9LAMI